MDLARSNLPLAPLQYSVLITHSSTASSTELVSLGDICVTAVESEWLKNSKKNKNDDWQRQSLRSVRTLERGHGVGDGVV